jgi:hypothetical protein
MIQEKINLRQSRDFGETFNASIRLIRQNFKVFFLSILFIAGPFVLLASIAGAFYQADAMHHAFSPYDLQTTNPLDIVLRQLGLWYFVFIIAASLGQMILTVTVYAFMITYQEKGPGNFGVNDVASRFGKNIANMLLTYIVLLLLSVAVIGILAGIVIATAMASSVLAILVGFLLVLGLLVVGPNVVWIFSTIYLAVMQPDATWASGFSRPGKVMRDNFWWTWVIVACCTIAVGLMGLIFTLPQGGYQVMLMLTKGGEEAPIGFIIVATICTFCATLLYSIMHIVFGVHFYSLSEKKDGLGMMDRINEIGTTQQTNVNQQY